MIRTVVWGENVHEQRDAAVAAIDSWLEGGEVFRSGCCWRRGAGRIFYLAPGHETYPIYRQPEIRSVLRNAVHWARQRTVVADACPRVSPSEPP